MANFGALGSLDSYRGSQRPTGLPQWLLDQMSVNNTTDESGGSKTEYSFNDNPYGGFQRNGKYYVQVGQNKLKDPSKVESDPELGDITEVGNVNDLTPQGPNWGMLATVLGAGALGTFAGLGSTAGGAGAAGAGGLNVADTGLSGLFSGSPQLAPALANGGWESALAGAGNFGPEAGGLLGGAGSGASGGLMGGSGLSPLEGVSLQPEPTFTAMQSANSTPWYQGMLNGALQNPLGAARTIAGLYGMVTAGGQHPGSTGGSSGPGGLFADTAGMHTFNPLQSMGQFTQNPYLAQAMMRVPFMGGR